MTSFLTNIIGNPFSTPVGQLIEKATDGSELTENWAMYLDICDLINSTEEGPRDAIKAFKKQLSNNIGKNNASVLYTLTVIETCVKNCGHRFHVHVAQRDFLQELVRMLTLKVLPPQIVVDRTLGLVQTWADAFQGSEELKEVERVCKELKEKGFIFPVEDFENAPPIHTPARKINPPMQTEMKQNNVSHAINLTNESANRGFFIDTTQLEKLKSELDVVVQNCKIFNELLTENTPGLEAEEDWKLMMDLNETSNECHKRLVELVGKYNIENITCDILPVNDEVTNVMLRFERYNRMKNNSGAQDAESNTKDGLVCISADSGAIQIGDAVTPDDFSNLFPSSKQDQMLTGVPFNPFAASQPLTPEKSAVKVVEMANITSDMNTMKITTIPYTNQEILNETKDSGSAGTLSASSHEFDEFLASKTPEAQQHTQRSKTSDKTDDLFSL